MSALRPMRPEEDAAVRALCARCHPEAPPRPPFWFFAIPTLVIAAGDGALVGYTSFTLNMDVRGLVMFGQDVAVDPAWRGRGLGRQLADARLAVARAVGAQHFLGITRPDNAAMLAIFRAQGLREVQTIPGFHAYDTPPADGVVYGGPLAGDA